MGIGEIVDFSRLGVFVIWVVIPIIILAKSFLARKFFSVFEFSYLIVSILAITYCEGPAFGVVYLIVYASYCMWWSVTFKQYREENPGEYEEYRKFYSEYYGDDLNGDGIKDAFEMWEIAHDPRFFWLFGSKMAKRERRLKEERDRFYAKTGFNNEAYNRRGYHGDSSKDYSQGAGSSFAKGSSQGSGTNSTRRGTGSSYGTGNNYSRSGSGYSSAEAGANRAGNGTGAGHDDPYMSEAEKKVAKQHEFARRYNLRYFAMCESKQEAKKLYRKYAAKFHPDNAVTGDKEKFIKVDEEYNRFCQIPEIS